MDQPGLGANTALPVVAARVTLSWRAGPGVPDVDVVALLLGESGDVGDDTDLVFYNRPVHASGAVQLAARPAGPHAADVLDVDLALVPARCRRIVLAASCDGGVFGQVPGLVLTVTDPSGGAVLATVALRADVETAVVAAELYRQGDGWRWRAVGQGYASGLTELAADFGVTVGRPAAPLPTPPR